MARGRGRKRIARQPRRWRWLRRLAVAGVLAVAVTAGLLLFLRWHLRPPLMDSTQLAPGVVYRCFEVEEDAYQRGRVVVVRLDLAEPRVRFGHRPFNPYLLPGALWRLTFADWALWRQGHAILMNSTLITPSGILDSWPGNAVSSVDTLVVDGYQGAYFEHNFLLWWDADRRGHFEASKPPPPEALKAAWLAVGLQRVWIHQGVVGPIMSDHDLERQPRTFIGIDGDGRHVFLIAAEGMSTDRLAGIARDAGVMEGSMLDSGDATNLLFGGGMPGMAPHSGIRNRRPLGGYLFVDLEQPPSGK